MDGTLYVGQDVPNDQPRVSEDLDAFLDKIIRNVEFFASKTEEDENEKVEEEDNPSEKRFNKR